MITSSEPIAEAQASDGTDIHRGQAWQDKAEAPDQMFLILNVQVRSYSDGGKRFRVAGVSVGDRAVQEGRSMDLESLRKLFPVLMFEPNKKRIETMPDEAEAVEELTMQYTGFNPPGDWETGRYYFVVAVNPLTGEDCEVAHFPYTDDFTRQLAYKLAVAFVEAMNRSTP